MFTSGKASETGSIRGAAAAILLFFALSEPLSAGLPPQGALSAQGRVALLFLERLDRGEVNVAYAMLEQGVQHVYPASKLAVTAKGRRPGSTRRIIYEGPIRSRSRPAAASPVAGNPYLVCVIELPRSGYGGVTYASITMKPVAASWRITDFQIASQPNPACRS